MTTGRKHRVVVIGGGFGGLSAVQHLKGAGADITIDAAVAEANFVAQRTDVESDSLYAYDGTATQAVKDLAQLWS